MTTAENIRALALEGLSTGDIARRLGIRYQHAYGVLRRSANGVREGTGTKYPAVPGKIEPNKPPLTVAALLEGGFTLSSRWIQSTAGELALQTPIPKEVGVYAFVKDGIALYVGVATTTLFRRFYFYVRPGPRQRTSLRLNRTLKHELLSGAEIEIYTASPPDLKWNGLPVHGSAGLELGLIKKYALPWNMRSAN